MPDDLLAAPTSQENHLSTHVPTETPEEAEPAAPQSKSAYAALLYVMSLVALILFVLALPSYDISISSRVTVCGILIGVHALGLLGLLWHRRGRGAFLTTSSLVLLVVGAGAVGAVNPLMITPHLTEKQVAARLGPPLKRDALYTSGTGQRYYTFGSGNPMNPGSVRLSGPQFDHDKLTGYVLRYRNVNLYLDAHGRLANWNYGWNMSK